MEMLTSEAVKQALEKTLGLLWNPNLDEFQLALKASVEKAQSKEEVLRRLMSVFDPLGFSLASILIPEKFLLQETWKKKIGWDEPLREDLQKKWQLFQDKVHWLKNVRIPRCYEVGSVHHDAELHIFCNASQEAIAAVAYVRIGTRASSGTVLLVIAPTKTAF